MKKLYVVVDKSTKAYLSDPTFERNLARASLQAIKAQGVKAIILSSLLDREQAKQIR